MFMHFRESRYTHEFKNYLRDGAQKLGIQGPVNIEEIRDPDVFASVDSHRYSFNHFININRGLLQDARDCFPCGPDGEGKKVAEYITRSDACAKFFGIQALQHIALNTVLYKEAAHVFSLILGATLLNSMGVFTEPGMVNVLLQGLTIKLFQYISEGLVEKYQTFRSDAATVSYTQDRKGAVEALLLLKKIRDSFNLGSLPQGFISIEERIEALDPNHEISLPDFSSDESPSRDLSNRTICKDPEQRELESFKDYINDLKACMRLAKARAPFVRFKLLEYGVKLVVSGSSLWPILPARDFAQALFPTYLPSFINPLNGLEKAKDEKVKEKAGAILQEMGSTIPAPEVFVGSGPAAIGNSVLLVPNGFEGETPEEDFILRHEMAHVKNNDGLTKVITSLFAMIFVHSVYSVFTGDQTSYNDIFVKGILVLAVQFVVGTFVSQKLEARADETAVNTAPNREKVAQSGAQVFRNMRDKNQRMVREAEKAPRETELEVKMQITSEGDLRTDFEHPTLGSRISTLEAMASKK